jgi:hypothetical protein
MENNEHATPIPENNKVMNQEETTPSEEKTSLDETSLNTEALDNNNNSIITNEKKKENKKTQKKTLTVDDKDEVSVNSSSEHTEELHSDEEIIIPQVQYEILTKEELVQHIEEIVKEPDTSIYKNQIGLIKVAFRKIQKEDKQHLLEEHIANGGTNDNFTPLEDNLDLRFNSAFTIYKENKAKQELDIEAEKQKNLLEKQKILEDLKTLVESEEELKRTYDAFKDLQERWKIIGQVPQKEKNDLWQSYHFLVEKFFAKVKINKELKDLDLKKNLEIKIELCEKTEELILEPSIVKSFQLLQNYHDSWKETGPVHPDKKDEIWQRFSSATEKINQRRQEFYAKLKEEQDNNYLTKTSLCEKIEQINELNISLAKEWQDKTDEINEIQKLWKTVGYAPKKVNNEVWGRFRKAINLFFDKKKDFFGKIKDDQTENYNQKINLCMQAEALKTNTNWKKTTEELIQLQQEWKKIGPVPKKFSDKIWKRFRAACDEFFNNKSSYFSNIDQHEEENLKLKVELIKKINEFQFGENANENFEILKNFQREWGEIGHVPLKSKDEIQNSFREIINKQYDKLKINSNEKVALNYKSKIEQLKNQPDAKHSISKEISFISTKLSSLKNDLKLWENNIGFLAHSKNADILKAEFDKKITHSKNEIKILEEKLKLLREMDRN